MFAEKGRARGAPPVQLRETAWIQNDQSVVNDMTPLVELLIDTRIVRFFPHEVADLSIALDYMLIPEGLPQDTSQWALRYIVLIWLSLICMIPFDLAQFDEVDQPGATATAIETLAKSYLGKAGLERDGAALLLSRFYMRWALTITR